MAETVINTDTLQRWTDLQINKLQDKEWLDKCLMYAGLQVSPICLKKNAMDSAWWDLLVQHHLDYDESKLFSVVENKKSSDFTFAVPHIFQNFFDFHRASRLAQAVWSYDQQRDFSAALHICQPMLAISPFERITFGGDLQQDVARMLYIAKIYFQMIKHVLASDLSEKELQIWLCNENNIKEAKDLRQEGNAEFKKGNLPGAVAFYTKGLELNRFCYLIYGNRAMCYLKMKEFVKAYYDGRSAVFCNGHYAKGFHHAAKAACELGETALAFATCVAGLTIIPHNTDLQTLFERIQALIEGRQLPPQEPNRRGEDAAPKDTPRAESKPTKTEDLESPRIEKDSEGHAGLEVKVVEAQSQVSYLEGVVADLKTEIERIRNEAAEEVAESKQKAVEAEVEVLELRKEAELRRLQENLERAETAAKIAGEDFVRKGNSEEARETHVTCLKQVADIKRSMDKVERQFNDQIQRVKKGTPLRLLPRLQTPSSSN